MAAGEIRALLMDVVDDLLPHSCEPRFFPLACALATLPGVPPELLREKLGSWFRAHLDPAEPEGPPGATAPAPKPSADSTGAGTPRRPRIVLAVVCVLVLVLLALLGRR